MEPVILDGWDRHDIYNSYRGLDFPYIIITAEVDATRLRAVTREAGVSFYFSMIYLASAAADSIRNFHYRIMDGEPYYAETVTPTAVHLRKGETAFVMVECDPYGSMGEFARKNRAKAELKENAGNPRKPENRTDIYNFSAIPWVHYTGFVRTIGKIGVDSNPKFTAGKYAEKDGRVLLPFSVQTHHGLMDGLHVGRFYERFQELLDTCDA